MDTIANYRRALIQRSETTEEQSSILVVVGREDTGDLEAQIRGSRHAWDVRLISMDALLRLLRLKVNAEHPAVVRKIHDILIPQEFTKVDGIVDLVFSAAEDARQDDEVIEEIASERPEQLSQTIASPAEHPQGAIVQPEPVLSIPGGASHSRTVQVKPQADSQEVTAAQFHDACVQRIQAHLKQSLVKQTRTIYAVPDKSLAVICIVSREYDNAGIPGYWYGFHTYHRDALTTSRDTYLGLGCGSERAVLLIPYKDFEPWLDGMHITNSKGRYYWHVKISRVQGSFVLERKKGYETIDLTKYLLEDSTAA